MSLRDQYTQLSQRLKRTPQATPVRVSPGEGAAVDPAMIVDMAPTAAAVAPDGQDAPLGSAATATPRHGLFKRPLRPSTDATTPSTGVNLADDMEPLAELHAQAQDAEDGARDANSHTAPGETPGTADTAQTIDAAASPEAAGAVKETKRRPLLGGFKSKSSAASNKGPGSKNEGAKGSKELVRLELPVRVLVGYLPDVSLRDALEYASGIANKHIDNLSFAYFDAHPWDRGYVYEVHEGGAGKAFLPSVLEHFKQLGPFSPKDDNQAFIRTGTRTVQVERQADGLSAVLLPEANKRETSSWLRAGASMRPAINKRTGVLVAGAVVFVTGFAAMLGASVVTRIQPYAPPMEPVEVSVDYGRLPLSQVDVLRRKLEQGEYITAMRYERGRWSFDGGAAAPAQPPTVPPATPPTASAPAGAKAAASFKVDAASKASPGSSSAR